MKALLRRMLALLVRRALPGVEVLEVADAIDEAFREDETQPGVALSHRDVELQREQMRAATEHKVAAVHHLCTACGAVCAIERSKLPQHVRFLCSGCGALWPSK